MMSRALTGIAFVGAAAFLFLVVAGAVSGQGVEAWQMGVGVILVVVGMRRVSRARRAPAEES